MHQRLMEDWCGSSNRRSRWSTAVLENLVTTQGRFLEFKPPTEGHLIFCNHRLAENAYLYSAHMHNSTRVGTREENAAAHLATRTEAHTVVRSRGGGVPVT